MKKKYQYKIISIITAVTIIFGFSSAVFAGTLTAPGTPSATSYTLNDIYTKLISNTSAIEGNHTLTTSATPAGTFHTLKEIYNAIPTIDPTKVSLGTTYLGVAGTLAGFIYGFNTTNQTLCSNEAGDLVSCTNSGQDGEFQKGNSVTYTDNSNSTITDNSTGLMWQKCSVGLSGTNCDTGTATTMNWTTATSTCDSLSFAGHSDWRLPNVNELQSLANYGTDNPAINSTYFPNTYGGYYWTSTTYMPTKTQAWTIDFSYGDVYAYAKSSIYRVRCVR